MSSQGPENLEPEESLLGLHALVREAGTATSTYNWSDLRPYFLNAVCLAASGPVSLGTTTTGIKRGWDGPVPGAIIPVMGEGDNAVFLEVTALGKDRQKLGSSEL